jgi:hypothetical protein
MLCVVDSVFSSSTDLLLVLSLERGHALWRCIHVYCQSCDSSIEFLI